MSRGRLHLARLLPWLLAITGAANARAQEVLPPPDPPAPPVTVQGLTALHHDGQTFLTWTSPAGTGWTYRVYASPQSITKSRDLDSATPLGAVRDSTWCDRRLSVITGSTYGYAIDSLAAPLGPTRGLFVVTPAANATTSYAVTAQPAGGSEERAVVVGHNALSQRVAEQLELPKPVFQRTLAQGGGTTADVYSLWTTDRATSLFPLMANRPGMAFDCAVVRGAPSQGSLLLALHARGGNFLQSAYSTGHPGQWVLALDDPLETRDLNTFWYGYDEQYDVTLQTNPVPTSGLIRPYTLDRVVHSLLWARRQFGVDTTRVYAYGFSMAAIGSVCLALRRPDLIAGILAIAGKFDFSFIDDPNPGSDFNLGGLLRGITDRLWGGVYTNLLTSEQLHVYARLNDGYMVGAIAPASLPPIIAMNGKNDLSVGWAEKIPFYRAMQDARQGGTFFWDPRDHYTNATAAWSPMQDPEYLYRFRTNLSFPALSHCSADGDPGDGHATSGDSVGTLNGFLEWDTTLVDQPTAWETTLRLRDLTSRWGPVIAPDSVTVDVTPRRLQRFPMIETTPYPWRVTRLGDGAIIQSGSTQPDPFDRLTIAGVKVDRSGSVLHITGPAVSGVAGDAGRWAFRIEPLRNPLPTRTTVRLAWPRAGEARLDLLDLSGRRMRELFHGAASGPVAIALDVAGVPPGVYLLLARQGAASVARRIVILR